MLLNFRNSFTKSLLIKTFCVLVGFLSLLNVNGQEINKKKTLRQARKALYKEQYINAQNEYMKLVNAEPTNDIYNFEAGLSYYLSTHQQTKSIPLFEAALQNSKEDTIVELYYFLGKSYQLNSEFEKANASFEKFDRFIDHPTKSGKMLKNDVNREIENNKNGINYLTNKNDKVFIENIGEKVNSIDREYAPVINKNGDILLFTSRRNYKGNKKDKGDLLPYEDIYAAKKTEAGWNLLTDKAELKKYLPDNVNTKKHDASITYSTDGNTIFTYKKDAIWQSNFKDGSWSTLKKLDDKINASKFNVPSVTISADGTTMFFVSTKKDGIGGKDIYKSVKKSNGEWELPVLLSNNINTVDDEDAPYLTEDGKTLYFSSTGHATMGGYDIYKSELVNGEWSLAENLGFPYNSPADDIYFIVDKSNENGFFSSSRVEGNGTFDIYSFSATCKNLENTEIRGIVYNNELKQPIKSTLTLTNLSTNKEETSATSLSTNGKFLLVAKPESQYNLSIVAEGFNPQTIKISTPKQCDYFQLFSEISLEKAKVNGEDVQIATLRNSFFNSEEAKNNPAFTGIDTASISKEVPLVKVETDNNYTTDKELIALSRKLDPKTTAEFTMISDTIKVDRLVVTNTTNTPAFGPIYFDFDKHNLSNDAKKELDKIINFLKTEEGKEMVLNIKGHTDGKRDMELNQKIFAKRKITFTKEASEQRSKNYNIELSKQRAETTVKYLKQKGIKAIQITTEAVGEEEPSKPNLNSDGSNNLENQKLNRRVTFKLNKQSVL
ncbi:MAG: PD40 domain-containing protein [Flavobacteriales bacterium]|nr:PD40 domain-containing protein [Flavobacteriales bacterium]